MAFESPEACRAKKNQETNRPAWILPGDIRAPYAAHLNWKENSCSAPPGFDAQHDKSRWLCPKSPGLSCHLPPCIIPSTYRKCAPWPSAPYLALAFCFPSGSRLLSSRAKQTAGAFIIAGLLWMGLNRAKGRCLRAQSRPRRKKKVRANRCGYYFPSDSPSLAGFKANTGSCNDE